MPRERISSTNDPFTVEFGWTRDHGTIQVATIADDGLDRVQRILADGGLKLVDAKTGDPAGTAQLEAVVQHLTGWHVHIDDRATANRLIRVAKTARDQTFGKDE